MIIIRNMRADDCRAAEALDKLCFSEPWSAKGFEDAIAISDNIFKVAVDEYDNFLAYCGLYVSFDEGEITNVAASPEHRHEGLGSLVVKATLDEAKEKGVKTIFLEVRQSNENAIALYKKYGFEECGIRKNFYSFPKEHAIVMRLEQ